MQQGHLFDPKLFVAEGLLKRGQFYRQDCVGVPFLDGDSRTDFVSNHVCAKLHGAKFVRFHGDAHLAVSGGFYQLSVVYKMACRNACSFLRWKRGGGGSGSVLVRGGNGNGCAIHSRDRRTNNDGRSSCRRLRAVRLDGQTADE